MFLSAMGQQVNHQGQGGAWVKMTDSCLTFISFQIPKVTYIPVNILIHKNKITIKKKIKDERFTEIWRDGEARGKF